jgi:hypothetical protein
VLPLHLGHPQKLRSEMGTAGEDGETRGFLILAYVSALEPTCPVHRREPTAHPTEAPDDGPNPPEERLP